MIQLIVDLNPITMDIFHSSMDYIHSSNYVKEKQWTGKMRQSKVA